MFKNYLKITLRNLYRQKLYALINIFGLSLGIGCCLVMDGLAVPGQIPAPILTPEIVAAAVISMVMVGIISGTVPAWRASRVEPSVTLRAE